MKSTVNKGSNAAKIQNVESTKPAILKIAQNEEPTQKADQDEKKVNPNSENVGQSTDKEEAKNLIENFGPIEKEVKAVVQSLQPSAEERIKRVKNFEILSDRYNFLKGKADDLSRFLLQNAGTNAKLIFKNQTGADFEISNSFVIEKALKVAAEELKILLLDTENEVLNYHI